MEAKIQEKFGDELDPPQDVEDLDLEGLTEIQSLTPADKTYLERFHSVVFLSLKRLGLKSLENMPNLPSLQLVQERSTV